VTKTTAAAKGKEGEANPLLGAKKKDNLDLIEDPNFERKVDLITSDAKNYLREHLLTKITPVNSQVIVSYSSIGASPQPPGTLVGVGGDGINMHIYCTGEGSPTIVLDAGLDGGTMSWAKVQEQVSNHTRVRSYDRAGTSWSEPGTKPRTFMRI
jgi:hypothetical protein